MWRIDYVVILCITDSIAPPFIARVKGEGEAYRLSPVSSRYRLCTKLGHCTIFTYTFT